MLYLCGFILACMHSIASGERKIACMHSSASGGWEDLRLFTSSLVP